jgi:hypothetical protein
MGGLGVLFLTLLIPGLLVVIWVVAVAMPRAMRDEQRLRDDRCLGCGTELHGAPTCPQCGRPIAVGPSGPRN